MLVELLADTEHLPPGLPVPPLIPTVAVLNLFIGVIAGSLPILIPGLIDLFRGLYPMDHEFSFLAAEQWYPGAAPTPGTVEFRVSQGSSDPFEYAMLSALIGLYTLSGVLYILLAGVLHRHRLGVSRSARPLPGK